MSRAAFVEALEKLDELSRAFAIFTERLQVDAASAMIAKAREATGKHRRRKAFSDMQTGAMYGRLYAARSVVADAFGRSVADDIERPYEQVAQASHDHFRAMRDSIRQNLDALAESAEVNLGDPILVSTVWASTYSSQGYGASRYAKGAAESDALVYRRLGVPVEVRTVKNGVSEVFEVWANVESIADHEIARRKKLSLRDWLKDCLRRGLDPRVFDPFLPHGIERRLGLDYFGNDVPKDTREVRA